MRKLVYGLLLVISVSLFTGCATTKNTSSNSAFEKSIRGTWKIDHVVCCGRTSSVTYGGKQTITFRPRKSKYKLVLMSNKVEKGYYSIEQSKIGQMLQLADRSPAIIRVEDRKLFIDWSYMDLNLDVYSRE